MRASCAPPGWTTEGRGWVKRSVFCTPTSTGHPVPTTATGRPRPILSLFYILQEAATEEDLNVSARALLPLPGLICREADAKLHLSLPMEHERAEAPADAPCSQCPTGQGSPSRASQGLAPRRQTLSPATHPSLHPGVLWGPTAQRGASWASLSIGLFFLLIKVQFTQHKINNSKMYNAVAIVSALTMLCSDDLYLVPPPKKTPHPLSNHPHSPSPSPGNHWSAFCLCGFACPGHFT